MTAMNRRAISIGLVLAACVLTKGARAADDAGAPPIASGAPSQAPRGIAVVAATASADATWPLAQGVYGEPSLRPSALDEPHARVLAGEPAPEGAAPDLKELGELRAAIKGDDAASRQLLATLTQRLHVASILIVLAGDGDGAPSARLFLGDASRFDAAVYPADDGAGPVRQWSGTVESLKRAFASPVTASTAPSDSAKTTASSPAPASKSEPRPAPTSSKPFYLSPWFWGALGAAAFGAGAVFLATRDTSGGQIHLLMQLPK